jgi:hypothetical protein
VSNPPIDGVAHPSATSAPSSEPAFLPAQEAAPTAGVAPEGAPTAGAAPEGAITPAPPPEAAMAPLPQAPPGWPVSTAPYGYPPVAAPLAPPKRGRASLIILSVLSTVLLVALGVLTVLYVNDRNTIAQQRTLIDSSAADLRAKSAELTRAQQDLETTKQDAQADKDCADSVRALYKAMQGAIQSIDPKNPELNLESPMFQAMSGAALGMQQKCDITIG